MLGHLDDLASDFSVLHGVRDITVLSGRAFCAMAWRVPAYQGVMAARLRDLQQEGGSGPRAPAQGGREWTPGTQAALQAEPAFKGLISFG